MLIDVEIPIAFQRDELMAFGFIAGSNDANIMTHTGPSNIFCQPSSTILDYLQYTPIMLRISNERAAIESL